MSKYKKRAQRANGLTPSFGTKLLIYVSCVSFFSLLLAILSILLYDTTTFRLNFVDRIKSQADILSQSCASAVVFMDAHSASETLKSLSITRDVIAACVYNKEGSVFAQFQREGRPYMFPSAPAQPSHAFNKRGLDVFRSIKFKNETVGLIHIRADLRESSSRTKRSMLISLIVLLVSLLSTGLLSLPLRKVILKPVLELRNAAEAASLDNDYSVRVKKYANDELGALADAFNQMITRVQLREKERDTAEEALISHRNHLEELVADRTATLEHLVETLEGAKKRLKQNQQELEITNKELEAFSYSVSHDLRAPLRAIDGFSMILLEDYSQQLDTEGQTHLNRIRAATQRMGRLIDDLLDLSRMNRRPLNKTTIVLLPIIEQIMKNLQDEQPNRPIELKIESLPPCQGDAHLLGVVWTNLLTNAVKFTSKKETAIIEIGSEIKENECVYFVKDNGAGFDMTYADKLFGVFQRLHTEIDFPGTGIGLATVQRIIHRHGGRIWAEGEIDQGATFFFTLHENEQKAQS